MEIIPVSTSEYFCFLIFKVIKIVWTGTSRSPICIVKYLTNTYEPVTCAYNPSYSGGRDQEIHGLKPACANSSQDPISKNSITKIGLVELLKLKALSSSSSTIKKSFVLKIFS
jgi:hypothetical protein